MITLYPYQQKLVDQARASMLSGKRAPLLVSPVGSGKTVIFSYLAARVASKGKRVLILAHRDELLDQISETLSAFQVQHSFIAAGRSYDADLPVHVCSVLTAARRLSKIPAPSLIISDEAHHCISTSTWGRVIAHFPASYKMGVTATPRRLSGEPLDLFDDLILGPSVSELIKEGRLSDYKIYAPSTIDTTGIKTTAGDYAKKALESAADKPSITGSAVHEYARRAMGKRAIAYCVSVEHARHVCQEFRNIGIASESIDGTMVADSRRQIVRSFREGKTQVLTSVDIVSEGFNLKELEVAISLRPTQSLGLWIQQTGRALRAFPGKSHAIILDHAGNTLRHGFPDDDREWSLLGHKKTRGETETPPAVKICPKCFAAVRAGPLACPYCGFTYLIQPREIEEIDGELEELTRESVQREKRREQGSAQTLEDLVQLGRSRGYKNPYGWASHLIKARQKSSHK